MYAELHDIAQRYMRRERPGASLQATALVNEAYMKLIDLPQVSWQDRAHFFAISANLMRRILVDAARAKGAERYGLALSQPIFPTEELKDLGNGD